MRFCLAKRLGKMPSRAAYSGICASMSIHTSHDDRTATITPRFTMMAPTSPKRSCMMAAMDGSAMPAMSAEV